nr:MAG TPA: hypothetical protein [Caudoviricetes sp.]
MIIRGCTAAIPFCLETVRICLPMAISHQSLRKSSNQLFKE